MTPTARRTGRRGGWSIGVSVHRFFTVIVFVVIISIVVVVIEKRDICPGASLTRRPVGRSSRDRPRWLVRFLGMLRGSRDGTRWPILSEIRRIET